MSIYRFKRQKYSVKRKNLFLFSNDRIWLSRSNPFKSIQTDKNSNQRIRIQRLLCKESQMKIKQNKKWSTTSSTNFNSEKLNFDIYQVFKLHFMWILGWGNVININQTKSKVKYIKIFHILVKCKTTNYVVKCANFSFASYFPIDAFVWLLLMAF